MVRRTSNLTDRSSVTTLILRYYMFRPFMAIIRYMKSQSTKRKEYMKL